MNEQYYESQRDFIFKSNEVIKSFRMPKAEIITLKLFNFGLAKITKKELEKKKTDIIKTQFSLTNFCRYYGIDKSNFYRKVKYEKTLMTVIRKELKIIRGFYFEIETEAEMKALKNEGTEVNVLQSFDFKNGKITFIFLKEVIQKYLLHLSGGYTKFYLPYTKFLTTKYTWPLYENLRSFLFKDKKTIYSPSFTHEWDFSKLAYVLDLDITGSYFKNIKDLKNRVLEPIMKDLKQTDIIVEYQFIKTDRKFTAIRLKTKLNFKKWSEQNQKTDSKKKQEEIIEST